MIVVLFLLDRLIPKAVVRRCYCLKNEISIKDFFSKSDQIRKKLADLVTFSEEIINGKLHFLCSDGPKNVNKGERPMVLLRRDSVFP